MDFDDILNQLTDDDICITYPDRVSDRIPTLRQTYVQYTLPEGHGYPLFSPLAPYDSTNLELREHGLRVGDVGWFDQAGGFYFCFNVFDTLDHPRNTSLLPGTKVTPRVYTPFPAPVSAIKTSCKGIEPMTILASKEIGINFLKEKITFTHPRTLGAATIYPSGGKSEDVDDSSVFDEYLAANAESWYEQLLTQVKMRNGSLHILLGVDTCSDFGRMSFNEPQNTDQGVDFCTIKPCGCSPRGQGYHWVFGGTTGLSLFSTGLCSESTYQLGSSIAVSLRTASVSLRDDIWTRLIVRQRHRLAKRFRSVEAGGPYIVTDDVGSIDSEIDETEDMRLQPWPELEHQDEQRGREGGGMFSVVQDHPALELHEHLRYQMPGAKATIVHDSVWMNVLRKQEDDFYPGSEVVLKRIQSLYDVSDLNGTALFVKKEERLRAPQSPGAQNTFDCPYPGCNEKFSSKLELKKHKRATLHKQRSSCIIC